MRTSRYQKTEEVEQCIQNNNLQTKIQGKVFSPKGPLGSARIGDPSNDFSSATNQTKTKRSKLFNGVLNPEKEQKINLENKIKFYLIA